MPDQRNANPDGTTNTTGWSKTHGTIQSTADGLRWYGSSSGTNRCLRVRIPDSRLQEFKSYLIANMAIRRNAGTAEFAYATLDGHNYTYIGSPVFSYTRWGSESFTFLNALLPMGKWVGFPRTATAQEGVDDPDYKMDASSDFVSPYGFEVEFQLADGGSYDFTFKNVELYANDDLPAEGNVIDSNDCAFTVAQPSNSLTNTFTLSAPNEAVTGITWHWGDPSADVTGPVVGSTSKVTVSHTFPAKGRYVVRCTTTNYASQSAFSEQTVVVPAGPFTADFQSEMNYLALSVDASPSVSPGLDPINGYAWDWGDGTTSSGKLQSHIYTQPGDYAVSLTISTTATQRTHTAVKAVTATTPPNPANYFTISKKLLEVTFAPSITNGSSYLWNFGDGSTSTAQAPTMNYAVPGTYTVTLTVNGTQTTSQTVTVTDVYKAIKLLDALRLEVAVPPAAGVIYNRIKNPDGVKGAWGWQTPLAGSTVVGSATSDGPKDKAVPGAKLIYTSSGSGTQVLQSAPVPVSAGQYVGAQFACTYVDGFYRVTVDALSSTGTVLGSSASTGYLGALGTAQRTVGYLLPTGTVAARIRINHYSNTSAGTPAAGAILQLRHLMLVTAATAALTDAVPYAEAENWQNILGSSTSLAIDREALNVGTFTATVADSALDPATADTIRPGQAVRLRAAVPDESGNVVWKNLYSGTLNDAKVAYVGKTNITNKSTRITLSASDAVTRLAQDPEPRGVALIAELPELLESTTVPYEINGSSGQVPTAAVRAWNENASVLDQVAITRDTGSGYAYVNRNNVLIVTDPQNMPAVVAGVVNEEVYSGIDATFDTGSCINSVTIKWLRYTPANGDVEASTEEVSYGPYENAASIETWGFHPATFTMQGVENTTTIAAKAAAILAANSVPTRRINSVTIPIRYVEDLHEGKALLDLYDLVQLAYARTSTSESARVTGIKHTISPDKWLMTLEFAQPGAVAAPQFTPSPPVPASPTVSTPFGARRATAGQTITTAVITTVNSMDTADGLSGGMTYNATTGAFTVPKAGIYLVTGRVGWIANATGVRFIYLRKNGASQGRFAAVPGSGAMGNVGTLTMILASGDTVDMQCYQTSGGNLATDWGAGGVGLSVTYLGA